MKPLVLSFAIATSSATLALPATLVCDVNLISISNSRISAINHLLGNALPRLQIRKYKDIKKFGATIDQAEAVLLNALGKALRQIGVYTPLGDSLSEISRKELWLKIVLVEIIYGEKVVDDIATNDSLEGLSYTDLNRLLEDYNPTFSF
jgi:hypothetical protein